MAGAARPAPGRPRLPAALLLAGLVVGCQASPAPAPPATTAPAGQQQPAPITFSGREAARAGPFLLAGGLTVVSGEHRGPGRFRVELLDNQGAPQRILFLAAGRYHGSVGLGLRGGIYRLAVAADTPWKVEVTQPRGRAGAALPQRYQGVSDAVVGPFRVDQGVRVDVEHDGPGDVTVELVSDQGPSLYFLLEDSGRVRASRTASGLQPGNYYLNVEAEDAWRLALHPA